MRQKQLKRAIAIMLSILMVSVGIPINAVAVESSVSDELIAIEEFGATVYRMAEDSQQEDTIAKEQPEVLTVNGVNAFETTQGEGWTYDADTKTLTLNGYNGGPIVAQCNLTIILTEGSTNTITADSKTGTALGNGVHFGQNYTLDIKGIGSYNDVSDSRPSLIVEGGEHAIHAVGSISIDNCIMTATNEATQIAANYMECVASENNLTISNSKVNVNSNGVGITCFNDHIITNSDITVFANVIGVHANNKSLEISSSKLDVTGGSAALYSYFGAVSLNNCEGSLKATTAGIYTRNLDAQYSTNISNSNLTIDASYGIMTYSDAVVTDSGITFKDASVGIFAYTDNETKYTANTSINGKSILNGADNSTAVIRTIGTYSCENGAVVNGRILENKDSKLLFSGTNTISTDLALGSERTVEILEGAEVVVGNGVSFDLVKVPSLTINGNLQNNGTVLVNGNGLTNNGIIQNNAVFTEQQGILINNGTIYSDCQATFTGEVNGTPVALVHSNLKAVEAVEATCTQAGNRAYYSCDSCGKYFEDENATIEITDKNSVNIEALDHDWEENWQADADNHWKKCNRCSETKDLAKHNFKWVIDKEVIGTQSGSKHEECEICGYRGQDVEIIPEVIDINDLTIEISNAKYTYSGKEKKPSVKITNGSTILKKNVDYKVTYSNNINVGTADIVIEGIGSYIGEVEKQFEIVPLSLQECTVSLSKTNYTHSGKPNTPEVIALNGDKVLKKYEDYSYTYKNNVKAGVGTVTVKGIGNYTGTVKKNIYISPAKPSLSAISKVDKGLGLSWTRVSCASGYEIYRSENGKAYSKVKTITDGSIVKWTDTAAIKNGVKYSYQVVAYTISGSLKSAKSAAKSTYRLDTPVITSISSRVRKQMTLTWRKNSQATYYHIQYSVKSDFSDVKVAKVTGANNVSKVLSNLTAGKKYYVRIKTGKTVNGANYFSTWSGIKSITIKK